ncbi:hypothetical protein LCGC14_1881570 [marine sediment metagenome]|uniref:Lipoprotein n=1 Tax=marine sediment metagenome TaxID=412755 RepID=A0A0F9G289_9ZZZZ
MKITIKIMLILILILLLSGCTFDGVSIGGTYLDAEIYGQRINKVMPTVLANFKWE